MTEGAAEEADYNLPGPFEIRDGNDEHKPAFRTIQQVCCMRVRRWLQFIPAGADRSTAPFPKALPAT